MNNFSSMLACADSVPGFLGLFDLGVAPPLLFYAYIPTIIVSIAFAIFLFRKNNSNKAHTMFLWVAIFFTLWVLNVMVQWTAVYHHLILLSWKLTAPIEILIFLFSLRFAYISLYSENKHSQKLLTIVSAAVFSLVVYFTPTLLNISSYDFVNCEGVVGLLWHAIYAVELVSLLIVFIWLVRYEKKTPLNHPNRKESLLAGVGVLIFMSFFSLSNIFGELTQTYEINLVGPLGMIIFIVLLSIMIVKYYTPRVHLATIHILVYSLWVLIFSLIFISDVNLIHTIVFLTLILTIVLGYRLFISSRKETEQKENVEKLKSRLEMVNERLTILDAKKNEFLSFATHQLRSPLTSIKWGLDSIKTKYSSDTVEHLERTTDDLIGTVNDLLDISKIEQGGMVIKKEEFELLDFVGRITEEFRISAEKKGLTLSFEFDNIPCLIHADPNKLRQVFVNLIDNAIKYTKEGSIVVSLKHTNNTAVVDVKDTGPGISKEELTQLFDKFLRGVAGKASQSGSGLGLYLAKKIVESHSATIKALSDGLGKGSTFRVEFPVKK